MGMRQALGLLQFYKNPGWLMHSKLGNHGPQLPGKENQSKVRELEGEGSKET